jgi:hypothetical protein
VAGPRDMGMEGQSRAHFGQRTQGDSYGAHGNPGRTSEEGRNIFIEALCRQLEHVTKAFVASSRSMMRELRRLKKVLDEVGLQLSSAWIPSVANKFADALSRRFSPGDLAVRQTLLRSVVDGMMAPLDSFPVQPLGEHPVFLRRQCHNELASHWSREETRLLCPPVKLMAAVVSKLRISKAPALLLMLDWPRQSWDQPAIDMSIKVNRLPPPPKGV